MDFVAGAIGIVGGGSLAFNIGGARDRYIAFLSLPDTPRAWRGYVRLNEPRSARLVGFVFFAFGVLLVVVGIDSFPR
jgi:hypothetical protein